MGNIDQRASDVDTGGARASVAITFGTAPPQNNTIMLFVTTRPNAATITWPTGFTQIFWDESGESAQFGWAYKVAGASEGTTFTVTFTTGDEVSLLGWDVSGLTTTPLDVSVDNVAQDVDVSSRSTNTTGTPSQASSFCVALWALKSIASTSPAGLSFTNAYTEEDVLRGPGNGDIDLVTSSKEISSAATQESTASWTSGGTKSGACLVVWKNADPGITPPPSACVVGASIGSVTLGPISRTPSPASVAYSGMINEAQLGAISFTPTQASSVVIRALLENVLTGITVTPSSAALSLASFSPQIILGPINVRPIPAGLVSIAQSPTFVFGAVSISPPPSPMSLAGIIGGVAVIGPMTVTPLPSAMVLTGALAGVGTFSFGVHGSISNETIVFATITDETVTV